MFPLALTTLAVALGLFFALWLVGVAARDASIVDMVWGAGFAVLAGVGFYLGEGPLPRRALVTGLVVLWGSGSVCI
jgi:steroid 5-alpha reductase family enzyme